ncbi:MAG: DUF1054 family protein [candidate division NC10 bacterium]|nr:DUF1054 family protein [candidate division NC10 bacterium]
MPFEGFAAKDFEVFTIPDFAGRMGKIRAQIQPKLLALGEALAPALARGVAAEVFAHVAKHMRRTVNPPDDTWVAFGPEKRGYKKAQHFKVAISRHCVRLLFEVGPEHAGKAKWAGAWHRQAGSLVPALRRVKGLGWYKNEHDEEPAADLHEMTPEAVRALGQELTRRRDGQVVLGRRLAAAEVSRLRPADFERVAVTAFRDLLPLYRLG